MAFSVKASEHALWEQHGLPEFGQFSDCVEYVNQRSDYGDSTRGEWFYVPEDILPPLKGVDYGDQKPNERAIIYGSFGNDHSPGASHYTYAEIYDMDDPEEAAEYHKEVAEWNAKPEYIEQEDDPEDLDEEDEERDDEEDEEDEED